MYLSIHINSLASFAGSVLILVFAVYSFIYINAFRSDRIVIDFFFLQISLFIFLFANAVYSTVQLPSQVLMWTKISYFGATSVILTSYRFTETVVEKKNVLLYRFFVGITAFLTIAIFIPGNHFFLKELNPVKTHSSVMKGDLFALYVIALLLLVAFSLIKLSRHVLSDKENLSIGLPLLIGFAIWFASTAFNGIFAAILSITSPQLWIGPTAMAFCMGFFTVKMAEHRHIEIERVKKEKEIIYNNLIHDKVSGVFTREYMVETLIQRIAQHKRTPRKDSLLFIDIDNFKLLNDELGHKTGDSVLKMVGRIFRESTRQEDISSRFGGDEFLILLDDCEEQCSFRVSEKIQREFAGELQKTIADWPLLSQVSLSIGIVTSQYWGTNPDEIIHNADLAMYRSKKYGKNKISLYNPKLDNDT